MIESGVAFTVDDEPMWLSVRSTNYDIELEFVLGATGLEEAEIVWGPAAAGHLRIQAGKGYKEHGGGTASALQIVGDDVYFEFVIHPPVPGSKSRCMSYIFYETTP